MTPKSSGSLGLTHEEVADAVEGLLVEALQEAKGFSADPSDDPEWREELQRIRQEFSEEAARLPFARLVGRRVQIDVTYVPGIQNCPWGRDRDPNCPYGSVMYGRVFGQGAASWTMRNLHSQREIRGPGLAVHLIRHHHFFEGFESPYRVDPQRLAEVLELGPFASQPSVAATGPIGGEIQFQSNAGTHPEGHRNLR